MENKYFNIILLTFFFFISNCIFNSSTEISDPAFSNLTIESDVLFEDSLKQIIKWEPLKNIESVKIEYDIGEGWVTIIPNTGNDGIFHWAIPYSASGPVKIKISDLKNENFIVTEGFIEDTSHLIYKKEKNSSTATPTGGWFNYDSSFVINLFIWRQQNIGDTMVTILKIVERVTSKSYDNTVIIDGSYPAVYTDTTKQYMRKYKIFDKNLFELKDGAWIKKENISNNKPIPFDYSLLFETNSLDTSLSIKKTINGDSIIYFYVPGNAECKLIYHKEYGLLDYFSKYNVSTSNFGAQVQEFNENLKILQFNNKVVNDTLVGLVQ